MSCFACTSSSSATTTTLVASSSSFSGRGARRNGSSSSSRFIIQNRTTNGTMMKNERRARSAKRGAASSERRRRNAFRVLAVASSSSSSDASGTGLKTKSDISSIFDDAKVTQETTFWGKLSAAYRIFFPPSEADTARAEAKKRLRMILVADRCTMSDESMEEMKRKIIDVVEQYVELDEDVPVDVKVKDDVKFGTVYGITVPVSKVKAEFDAENEAYMIGAQFVYDDETWEELQKETDEEED